MTAEEHPVLSAVVRAATALTGAAGVSVLAVRGEEIVVLACEGPDLDRAVGDRLGAGEETARFVLAGGRSMSLAPAATPQGDSAGSGRAYVCVPCVGADGVVGAFELWGQPGGEPLDLAATRVAALLGDVVGAALTTDRDQPGVVPSPGELGAELTQLAGRDGPRYEAVAQALETLLAYG